jgi:hypothetical protein
LNHVAAKALKLITIYVFSKASRPAVGPMEPPFQPRDLPEGPAREVDHTPSYSVEVNNQWSNNSTSPYIFYGMHRGDFTFSHLRKSISFKKL